MIARVSNILSEINSDSIESYKKSVVYLCGDKAKPAKAAETEKQEGCKAEAAAASSAKAEAAAAVRACYWSTVGVFAV